MSEFAEMPQILLLVVLLSGAAAFAKDENDSKSAKGEDFMRDWRSNDMDASLHALLSLRRVYEFFKAFGLASRVDF